MSLSKDLIDEINRANTQKSTGPRSVPGKQRSRMNAVKHNLSGQHLILQDTELAAYNRMSASMLNDLNPKSEPERRIAHKAQRAKGSVLRVFIRSLTSASV
jgi:hypothetical protein